MSDDQAYHPETEQEADWPLRPWLLGGLGAIAGLLVHLLTEGAQDQPLPVAGAAFVLAFALGLAFTIDHRNWRQPLAFAVLAGLVVGGLAFQTVRLEDRLAGEEYAFAAGLFAVALALPLFQAGFHRTRFSTPYRTTHFHVWTDAVAAGGAVAFTLLSWAMLFLLDGLLGLVGLDFIGDVMDEEWFGFAWTGGAFGTALGVLRNNLKVIGALQSVVLIVLSLLAVPLALALIVFLVALVVSGGNALWQATDSATPVLLICAIGCFVLANAIVRQDDEARSDNRIMQATALVLCAGIMPLAVFAAISMGIRIDQYGLAPERIWAVIAIAVASAYGLAYWIGLARGRRGGWAARLRQANLHLAAGTCLVALVLALPIFDFGAISTRNQLARLEAGEVSAEEFDFAALRWDFGAAGRRALARLATGEGEVADLAAAARDQSIRPPYGMGQQRERELAFRVQPADPALHARLERLLRSQPWRCQQYCVALDLGSDESGKQRIALVEGAGYEVLLLADTDDGCALGRGCALEVAPAVASPPVTETSTVEIREVTRRHIVIDGVPLEHPIDEPSALPPPTE